MNIGYNVFEIKTNGKVLALSSIIYASLSIFFSFGALVILTAYFAARRKRDNR